MFSFKQPSPASFGLVFGLLPLGALFVRHPVVIFGGIWYICIPVHPGIIRGKTSNHIEIMWDNSKLKKLNRDKRRNKTVQEGIKHHAILRALWALRVMKNKTLLRTCQICPCNKRGGGTVSDQKENAFCANQPVDLLFPEAAD